MPRTDRDLREDTVQQLRGLKGESFDVIVVGGGINGAGIARAAARRGYRVLLLEKHDFGWGTTWRSSKLIHGGLRYLEHGEFGLVFESLHDQAILLRDYPEMVRPLTFLLPTYRDDRHGPRAVGLGLTLYDVLARRRGLPPHRRLAPGEVGELEPALRMDGLAGGFTYSDSQAAYPERLCLTTALEASQAGTTLLNHVEVTGLLQTGGRVAGVVARSGLSGEALEVRGRVVVNAAGPWVDALLSRLPHRPPRQIGGTKGAHIVVDCGGAGPLHTLYAEARSDHRPFFIIPWRNLHLIGTTDTPFSGDLEEVRATDDDVAYLLDETAHLLPGVRLELDRVLYGYAGVRPLPWTEAAGRLRAGRAGAITRRHLIRDHAVEGHAGLLSIIGGKLSTYRSLAAQVLQRLEGMLGEPRNASGPLPASDATTTSEPACQSDILGRFGPPTIDYLRQVYGPRLTTLLSVLRQRPELGARLCPHGPDLEAQLVVAARSECGVTLSDVLLRRTGVGWNPCHGLDAAERAAELLADELHWSPQQTAEELRRYADEVRQTFTDLRGCTEKAGCAPR